MRAALYLDAGHVVVDDVPDPTVQQPTDAVVRVVRVVCLRLRPLGLPRHLQA